LTEAVSISEEKTKIKAGQVGRVGRVGRGWQVGWSNNEELPVIRRA